jgi:hypothetical protein
VFVALNPKALPARPRSPAELHQWVRRDEEYATLGANVVVELNSESRARQPTTRAWAIIRRADRAHRRQENREQRGDRHPCRPHHPYRPTLPAVENRHYYADSLSLRHITDGLPTHHRTQDQFRT